MKDIDKLTMEEIKERIDTLQAYVRQTEGDPDLTGEYFDELKHLQEVYDRMIMDSQGRGIQMMQDIPDKPSEHQDNYVAGVPVASSQTQYPEAKKEKVKEEEEEAGEGEAEVKAPTPAINLTINVVSKKEDGMEKSFDEKVSELAKSGSDRLGADIRIPLDIATRMKKSGSGNYEKAEGESMVDSQDLGKMREQKKKMVAGETPDYSKGGKKKKKRKDEDEEEVKKSLHRDSPLYRAETNTLEKGRMKEYAMRREGSSAKAVESSRTSSEQERKMTKWSDALLERYGKCIKGLDTLIKEIIKKVGVGPLVEHLGDYAKFSRSMAWAIEGLRWKKVEKDKVFKAIENTLEKSGTLVAGKKAPTAAAKASVYKKICYLNARIAKLEADCEKYSADPKIYSECATKLNKLYEQLAIAVMSSEGLGLKTEDMSRDIPDPRFDQPYGFKTVADKSQSQDDIEKGGKRSGVVTGKVGKMKYAMTYWDAEGGLTHGKAQKIAEAKVPSLKRAIKRRLNSKIPHLADATTGVTEHVIALGGDEDAPIKKVPGSGKVKSTGHHKKRGKGHYKSGGKEHQRHVVRG